MDPCECVDMFNTQVLIGHILNLVNSQTECTDSHCFTSTDVGGPLSGRIDPAASFSTIGVAVIALLVLALVLPINVRARGRNTSHRTGEQTHKQNADKKNQNDHDHDHDNNGPGLAM